MVGKVDPYVWALPPVWSLPGSLIKVIFFLAPKWHIFPIQESSLSKWEEENLEISPRIAWGNLPIRERLSPSWSCNAIFIHASPLFFMKRNDEGETGWESPTPCNVISRQRFGSCQISEQVEGEVNYSFRSKVLASMTNRILHDMRGKIWRMQTR